MTASGPILQLAFYGDDLTGSTDALEALALGGVKCVLFLDPPRPADLRRYPGLQAIGVAGMTRAMAPAAMGRVLRRAFAALKALRPRFVHYKVCSTFDSSPKLGSIGRAADIGGEVFRTRCVPVLGGAPALGRYCAFGNLFARMGIGTDGPVYRLDRHPSMSRHPATPATESDLRLVLAKQTKRKSALIDFRALDLPLPEPEAMMKRAISEGAECLLFDALSNEHVSRVGALLEAMATDHVPLFSVGPSSIEQALAPRMAGCLRHGRGREGDAGVASTVLPPVFGLLPGSRRKDDSGRGGDALVAFSPSAAAERRCGSSTTGRPVLIASGSGSVVTARQVKWALNHGFYEVCVEGRAGKAVAGAVEHLRAGRSIVVHAGQTHPGERFGWQLGAVVRKILEETPVRRIVLAGGDSSSHAARAMGIVSLEMIAPLTPGAPLCRACAPGSPADGAEIVFKGGQVGGENYFAVAAGFAG